MEQKELVLAVLGASAGLGGFVLVFLGVLISTLQSFGATRQDVLRPYKISIGGTLIAFVLSLMTVFIAFLWLLGGGSFDLMVFSFEVQLGAVALVALLVTWQLTFRSN